MNIGEALRQSGAIDSIARELGVDPQMAQMGASVLLPAIVAGVGRSNASPSGAQGGLGDLIGAVIGGGGGGLLDMVTGAQPTPVDAGNDILGQIFGNRDTSRSVAAEAAGASGLSSDLLKRMLPLLAMAVMGYLAQRGGASAAPAAPGAPAAPAARAQPDLGGLFGAVIGALARR
jgi:hypothetical protein